MDKPKGFVINNTKGIDYDYREILYTVNIWNDSVWCIFKSPMSTNENEDKVKMSRQDFVRLIIETHQDSNPNNTPDVEDSLTRNEDHYYILIRDCKTITTIPRKKTTQAPIRFEDPVGYKQTASSGERPMVNPLASYPINTKSNMWWNK